MKLREYLHTRGRVYSVEKEVVDTKTDEAEGILTF
jgi:hypothetical protein